ncbi:MAG: hypothetical protein AAGG48_11180 [Planctomycetota bacterium]
MTTRFNAKTLLFVAAAALGSAVALGLTGGHCYAGSGSISRENGVVYIEGDEFDDTCTIILDGNEIDIELAVGEADGDVDTTDRDYDLDDVTLIVFYGFSGNDTFYNNTNIPCRAYGGAGIDVLWGGSNDDDLYGGPDSDWLYGEDGNDDLFGERGMDGLFGGDGEDYLKAGLGEDEYYILGQGDSDTFATPGMFDWYSRMLVPVNRNVFWVDFDPNEDTETIFYAPFLRSTPILFRLP